AASHCQLSAAPLHSIRNRIHRIRWRNNMRGSLLAWIMACTLTLSCCAPAFAQQQQPPMPEKLEPAKPPEPKKIEREGGSAAVSYTLAAIGTIIVMVLVCMPARRE